MSSSPEAGEESQPEQRPDPAQPAGTNLLPDIRHIVVLMMENHSYDNYLGMLEGRGDGLALGPDGLPTAANLRLDGEAVPLRHAPGPVQVPRSPARAGTRATSSGTTAAATGSYAASRSPARRPMPPCP